MSRLLASQRQTLGAGAVGSLLIAALVVVVAFIVLFPWFPGGLRLEVGSTVERAIVAPRDESYDSDLLTEQVREAAAAAVVAEPVFDSGVRDRQLDELDRILNAIDVARANRVLSASARESTIRARSPARSARTASARVAGSSRATFRRRCRAKRRSRSAS
jgi:membrane-associated HD superfamily phosphohydrolase